MNTSNVREVKRIQVIWVESIKGEDVEKDPMRSIYQIYSMDGELLMEKDTWFNKDEIARIDILKISDPLRVYVEKLLREGDIIANNENLYDITVRCWKKDRDTLDRFDSLIRMGREALIWKEHGALARVWTPNKEDGTEHRCVRCGKNNVERNEEKLCAECHEKIVKIINWGDL